ncbi:MAG: hypothetical protein Q8936_24190 [Bacillota bacterium]|nr:hypothetical protein [Bacillota bacterium]
MTKYYLSEIKKREFKNYKKCRHCGGYVDNSDFKHKAYGRYQMYFDICFECFHKKESGWTVQFNEEFEDDFFSRAN